MLFSSLFVVAFQVFNNIAPTFNASPIGFTNIPINIGQNYHIDTSSFQPHEDGLYWFHFDTLTDKDGKAFYGMSDIFTDTDVNIFSNNSVECILSRDDIRHISTQSNLQMFSKHEPCNATGDILVMTWSGFRINDVTNDPFIAFSVTEFQASMNVTFFEPNTLYIQFSNILLNQGNCWNTEKHAFISPIEGIFLISASLDVTKKALVMVEILSSSVTNTDKQQPLRNGEKSLVTVSRNHPLILHRSFQHTDITQTVSGSAVVQLVTNDSLMISTEAEYENLIDKISFKGFLYAPLNNNSVAWSVRLRVENKQQQIESFDDIMLSGIISYEIFSNANDAFNNKTNLLVLPTDGVYYVTFSVLVGTSTSVTGTLLVNNIAIADVFISRGDGFTTYERALLLQLMTGDRLSVKLRKADNDLKYAIIYFAGLLIVPQ